ncbi:hypothetical protein TI39_contig488g00002 [Zymoseptoria brevis]|uniref:Peptidase A1 domain-containing protein n=1 Tax=Zymoseptoria brevis TaxID=1047168 RepID=A0A0F4GMQ8_9PEZI|nr:hypothetical protein TI39_contig488g00002 [Zymoseptoria brevis]
MQVNMSIPLCAALALVALTYAAPQPVNDDGFTPLKVITDANHLAKRDGHILPLLQIYEDGLSDAMMFPGVDVTVGGQTFRLLLDTAASDIWIPSPGFKCLTAPVEGFEPRPQDFCVNAVYHSDTLSGGMIDNLNYNETYSDLYNAFYGRAGYETVTIAGVTVKKQQIGFIDEGHWDLNNTAGCIGLAFPLYASAFFPGNDPSQDKESERQPAINWHLTAIKEGSIAPVFSHIFEKGYFPVGHEIGKLALGGIPDVELTTKWASSPILKVIKQDLRAPLSEAALKNTPYPDYSKYKITGEGVTFTVNGKTFPALDGTGDTFIVEIDSGSIPVFAAKSVIENIAAALDPPFKYDSRSQDTLYGPCNTTLKDMTLNIGGVPLPISKDSLMYTTTDVPGPPLPSESNDECAIAFSPNSPAYEANYLFLGTRVLREFVTVYDVGKLQMRFAGRK